MTSETGILRFGAYIPRNRLQRSAIFAANGWFAGGLKGLAKGERASGGAAKPEGGARRRIHLVAVMHFGNFDVVVVA